MVTIKVKKLIFFQIIKSIHIIKKIQNLQSDVLEFQNIYYQKERKELTNWYLKDTLVNIDLDINKNGLIFEVNPNE